MKFKKGDKLQVMTGKDRGKAGKVLAILNDKDTVLVEGVNLYKKHQKAKKQGEKGEVVLVPRPMRASKLMFLCSACGRATRLGSNIEGEKRERICKKCGAAV